MGIREYFKQHPEEEDLKIQNMMIKESVSKSEFVFNPEDELTDETWENIKNKLAIFRKEGDWLHFIILAKFIYIAFSEKFPELQLGIEEFNNAKNKLKEYIRKKPNIDNLEDWRLRVWEYDEDGMDLKYWADRQSLFVHLASDLKILFPEKSSELQLNDESFENIKILVEHYNRSESLENLLFLIVQVKILFPKIESEILLDENNFLKIRDVLKYFFEQQDWHSALELIWLLKIIFPNRIAEFQLSEKAFKDFRLEAVGLRRELDWLGFCIMLMKMKILVADKIEITDQGLEIIEHSPADFKVEKTKRPERRSF